MKLDIVVRNKESILVHSENTRKEAPSLCISESYLVIVYLIANLDIFVRNKEVSLFLVKTLRKKYPCETPRVLVKDM